MSTSTLYWFLLAISRWISQGKLTRKEEKKEGRNEMTVF
jgi:hypothetical protein